MAYDNMAEARWSAGSLPEFQPPASGWEQVLQRRASVQRSRRQRQVGALGGAAALLVAWLAFVPAPAPLPMRSEAQLQPLDAELARIDRALQRAYDRGAASDEMAALWQARAELAQGVNERIRGSSTLVAL